MKSYRIPNFQRVIKKSRRASLMVYCAIFLLGYFVANLMNSISIGERFTRTYTPKAVLKTNGVTSGKGGTRPKVRNIQVDLNWRDIVEERRKPALNNNSRTEVRDKMVDTNLTEIVEERKKPAFNIDSKTKARDEIVDTNKKEIVEERRKPALNIDTRTKVRDKIVDSNQKKLKVTQSSVFKTVNRTEVRPFNKIKPTNTYSSVPPVTFNKAAGSKTTISVDSVLRPVKVKEANDNTSKIANDDHIAKPPTGGSIPPVDERQLTNNVELTDGIPHTSSNQSVHEYGTVDKPIFIDIDREIPDVDYLYDKLVIVTAFSQDHYKEAQGIIGTAQMTMPGKKIIVYDLGIRADVRTKVKKWCDVELRKFPFKSYPKWMHNLLVYSWKPIIINITLNEFGAIFWGDSSVRFIQSLKLLLPSAIRHHGYMSLIHSFSPEADPDHQYHHTYETMYMDLGVNRTEYFHSKIAPHFAANRQLFINSSTIQEKLLGPLVTCAKKLRCIAPVGSRRYMHRYDASALAIIAYKNLKGEWTPENNDNKIINRAISIERRNGEKHAPKSCS